MKISPSFNFYAEDFLSGTIYLTNEEVGMYIRLLCKQWTDGFVPINRIKFLAGVPWHEVSLELRNKFESFQAEGSLPPRIINPRLDQERKKRLAHSEKQRQNAKKRWSQKDATGMPSHKSGISQSNANGMPLETRNKKKENRTKKEGVQGEKKMVHPHEGVEMTFEELERLQRKYGDEQTAWMVERLGNYKLSSGRTYKSDYRAILSWVVSDYQRKIKGPQKGSKSIMDKIRDKHGIKEN